MRPSLTAILRSACARVLRHFGEDRDAAWALVAALQDRDVTTRDAAALSCAGVRGAARRLVDKWKRVVARAEGSAAEGRS